MTISPLVKNCLHYLFCLHFVLQLAGIDKPNDGKCHLVPYGNKGEYIYSEELTQVTFIFMTRLNKMLFIINDVCQCL